MKNCINLQLKHKHGVVWTEKPLERDSKSYYITHGPVDNGKIKILRLDESKISFSPKEMPDDSHSYSGILDLDLHEEIDA